MKKRFCAECGKTEGRITYRTSLSGDKKLLCWSCMMKRHDYIDGLRKQFEKIRNDIKWDVWISDDFTCCLCGTRKNLTIDHIIPLSKNGSNDLSNLRTLCKPCNTKKGGKL